MVSEQTKSEVKSPEARTPMDPRAKTMIVIVSIAIVVIVALLVVAGFFLYSRPQATTFFRDIAIIVLAFETLMVIFFEIKPVLNATSETIYTVRGTTTFVSDTVVSPIMSVASIVGAVKGAAQAIADLRPKGQGKRGSD
jgi:hypothetical protein